MGPPKSTDGGDRNDARTSANKRDCSASRCLAGNSKETAAAPSPGPLPLTQAPSLESFPSSIPPMHSKPDWVSACMELSNFEEHSTCSCPKDFHFFFDFPIS